ncbi:hypothetical protein K504DRAFT_458421 [Pleomassaria siparia CBS 279.74]|uniref:Uncharacterized protein n=1 Tax=Pleomassaria siparia CBS 279.74 TaxID=1314801 RepID=A0A6G1K665_9PLEO|nr:hypothetical protein K504DRAFT_458421 [Pleomassaria siparia CBS 279.74]
MPLALTKTPKKKQRTNGTRLMMSFPNLEPLDATVPRSKIEETFARRSSTDKQSVHSHKSARTSIASSISSLSSQISNLDIAETSAGTSEPGCNNSKPPSPTNSLRFSKPDKSHTGLNVDAETIDLSARRARVDHITQDRSPATTTTTPKPTDETKVTSSLALEFKRLNVGHSVSTPTSMDLPNTVSVYSPTDSQLALPRNQSHDRNSPPTTTTPRYEKGRLGPYPESINDTPRASKPIFETRPRPKMLKSFRKIMGGMLCQSSNPILSDEEDERTGPLPIFVPTQINGFLCNGKSHIYKTRSSRYQTPTHHSTLTSSALPRHHQRTTGRRSLKPEATPRAPPAQPKTGGMQIVDGKRIYIPRYATQGRMGNTTVMRRGPTALEQGQRKKTKPSRRSRPKREPGPKSGSLSDLMRADADAGASKSQDDSVKAWANASKPILELDNGRSAATSTNTDDAHTTDDLVASAETAADSFPYNRDRGQRRTLDDNNNDPVGRERHPNSKTQSRSCTHESLGMYHDFHSEYTTRPHCEYNLWPDF